jgi:SAM-dependent methyltransferase
MKSEAIVDSINRRTMQRAVNEYAYDGLTPPERAALASVANSSKGKRILDLGVGAGRTVPALHALSEHYVGVDYVPEMVARCRERFPNVRFEVADARSLTGFADRSFDLVVFACNGLSMVAHEGRLAILKEVRRLLAPEGHFIFSTYNRNNKAHERFFTLPGFSMSFHPLRLGVRAFRFGAHAVYGLYNRIRFARHEVRTDEYSIINDRCHHYGTMLYYINPHRQFEQLQSVGFRKAPTVFDRHGEWARQTSTDDSLTYVVTA